MSSLLIPTNKKSLRVPAVICIFIHLETEHLHYCPNPLRSIKFNFSLQMKANKNRNSNFFSSPNGCPCKTLRVYTPPWKTTHFEHLDRVSQRTYFSFYSMAQIWPPRNEWHFKEERNWEQDVYQKMQEERTYQIFD